MARTTDIKIHGQHACRAVLARRPDDVIRLYLTEALVAPMGDVLRERARRRLPYKVVGPDELEALTESTHHEGICVVARPRPPVAPDEVLRGRDPAALVALVDVGNPHNVGAILRTAAHFGARAALLGGQATARLPPAAHRTAQGGAEWLDLVPAPDLETALAACRRARFAICATTSHGGRDLYATALPERAVVLVGSEGEGLPRALMDRADFTLRIPGTGNVESLNVSAAAAVVLGELWRRRKG